VKVGVVGLGLVGGSLARALGEAGHAVAGYDADAAVCEAARRLGLCGEVVDDAEAVARDADVVVLAVPVGAMARALEALSPVLAPGTIVTDTGSTKAELAAALPGLLPDGVPYVPGHPIAGSHESGPEAARADLFRDHVVVLCDAPDTDGEAVRRLEALWTGCGARVVHMSADVHDRLLAYTSHLPHAIAFALARAAQAGAAADDPDASLAGDGLRDTTRLAGSDVAMWRDILVSNAGPLLEALDTFGAELDALREALRAGDADAVRAWLETARLARAWIDQGSP